MWLRIVSGLCLPLGIGIGMFTKNIFYTTNEKIMGKTMQSIQNESIIRINIPTLFWFGVTIPIWILSIWIICEKIYYRKNDLVMNLIQSCITIFQDKSLSNWFQSVTQKNSDSQKESDSTHVSNSNSNNNNNIETVEEEFPSFDIIPETKVSKTKIIKSRKTK